MVGLRPAALLRSDKDEYGRPITAAERARLLQPYLPEGPARISQRRKPIRTFIKTAIHVLIFNLMQLIFGIWYRIRRTYRNATSKALSVAYHHHRSPELIRKDVRALSKLPKHLSVILDLDGRKDMAALETLVNDACECVAWTACAGIPTLSIYERTGALKGSIPTLHRRMSAALASYYGNENPARPTLTLRSAQSPAYSPPLPLLDGMPDTRPHLDVLVLSEVDSRTILVDLTKTLAEMSQRRKLTPADISTELIDAELSESVMGEPDLLILFGDEVVLKGYPPWQVRLTEIFHVPDNHEVDYQVFMRGLHKFAGAQMRFGS